MDKVGRLCTAELKELLKNEYKIVDSPPPIGKDFNDFYYLIWEWKDRNLTGKGVMPVDCMMVFCKEQSINSVGIYKNIEAESEETIIERIQSKA